MKYLTDRLGKRTEYFREYRRFKRGSKLRKMTGSLGEFYFGVMFNEAILVRKSTHDFELWNQKVEVKTSLPKENGNVWEFSVTGKQQAASNFVFLICLDKLNIPIKLYILPSFVIPGKTIRIGITPNPYYERFTLPLPAV